VLSGFLCFYWLRSEFALATAAGGTIASNIADIADSDVTSALKTIDGPAAFLARFKERAYGCREPLAWVSVAAAPGQPAGTIRLRSGNYFSPVFDLSATPVRVAIPYPAPYETGRGMLTVAAAGGSAIIALVPAWHVASQDGEATRVVVWHPTRHCGHQDG
jgi:hypothetical protein